MPASSPAPLLFSTHLFSFLVSLLFLLLLSFPPISAATSNDTSTSYRALPSFHPHKKCVHEHLSALLQLKRGFNLSHSFTNLSSWDADDTDCCSWEGINCDAFTGHVIGLNLSRLLIAGVIDFERLFHLRSLQTLDLSDNEFDGSPIPSGLAQLSSLAHLKLSSCNFYGQIPLDISHLTRLVSLDVSYNEYDNGSNYAHLGLESSGMEELFRNLSSLRELYLDWVDMSAVVSQWSRILPYSLPNLRKLSMSSCRLSGPIHPSLSRLHFLTHLDLSSNDISSPLPQFIASFTSLASLSLSKCDLHREFPKNIFNLPKLRSIDIYGNQFLAIYLPKVSTNNTIQQLWMAGTQFHGNLADILGNFKSLTDLDLSSCNLLGPMPQSHVNLSHLVNLDLSYNHIQGPIPRQIFYLTELRYLQLSSNNFGGVLDLVSFQNLKNLAELDLSHNYLSAIINTRNSSASITSQPSVNLSQLARLDLSSNNFQGPIPSLIFSLTELRILRLLSNKFSGVLGLGSFQNLKNLVELDLSHNNLSAIINSRNSSASIASQPSVNLSQLSSLDLSSNSFQGPIPRLIFELTELTYLGLSSNNLSGAIYLGSFQKLKKLAQLDLSYNSFSAIINTRNSSASIASQPSVNLSQLIDLDLSSNDFQGPIPSLIFSLTELRILRLSSNNFGGVLDLGSFQNLKNLAKLDLSHNNLSAIISTRNSSASITSQPSVNLSQLASLDLSSNNFQGPIPRLIFEITELTYLRLSSNNLSGVINLGSFQKLKKLEQLDLSYNSFSAIINARNSSASITSQPSVNLSQLAHLDLSSNNFQGPIPSLIFSLTELRYLQLSSNNFGGSLDLGSFQNLKNLVQLVLSHNSFSAIINATNSSISTSFPQLSYLYLRSCNISKFPDILRNQEKMVILDLSSNRITGKIPRWVWKVGNGELEYLNLSNNALEGFEGPFSQLSSSSMRYLDLSNNMLKGSILIPSPSSRFFSLANNTLDGEVPSLICDATSLAVLDLSNNNFTGMLPQCLGKISDALTVLDLHKNAFRGPLLQTFKVGCTIETLDVSDNQLEGRLPRSLANCKKLTVLNLRNNQMKDGFPSQLANLSNLLVLVLRSNKFSGSIGQPVASQDFFPTLQIIDLSFNNFSGSLPSNLFSARKMMKDGGSASESLAANNFSTVLYYQDKVFLVSKGIEIEFVKILFAFTVVDLSHNQFDGDIPSSIGELKALHVLNMSHNHFKREIPASLGNLRDLESLDLSNNGLSGKIPWQLTQLSFLAVLNLSQNQLIGSIPQGRQFDTFQNDSFLGNPELCGYPLSRKCQEDADSMPPGQPDDESELDFMWIGFGVGHGVGIGIFFWTLALWRKGRRAFFMFVDRVLSSFFNLCKMF